MRPDNQNSNQRIRVTNPNYLRAAITSIVSFFQRITGRRAWTGARPTFPELVAQDSRSVVVQNELRRSLNDCEALISAPGSAAKTIDAGNNSKGFEILDLTGLADNYDSINDDSVTKFSLLKEIYFFQSGTPYAIVPAIIMGENGMTFTDTASTSGDPRTVLEGCLSAAEHMIALRNEIIPKVVYDGGTDEYIAKFEIDIKEIINNIISKIEESQLSSDPVPQVFLAFFIAGQASQTVNYQRITRRQWFTVKNNFGF